MNGSGMSLVLPLWSRSSQGVVEDNHWEFRGSEHPLLRSPKRPIMIADPKRVQSKIDKDRDKQSRYQHDFHAALDTPHSSIHATKVKSKRKLLITGANGFVAGSILAQAGNDWLVHALSRNPTPASADNWQWHAFNPSAPRQLEKLIRELQPDSIIHTAALADIDFCQNHPELARAVNVDLTRQIAEFCARANTRLIFCSTDTIFDGEHAPYKEEDAPGPVNLYAETKVEAEQLVRGVCRNSVVARLALVVGLPILGAGNSFLPRMIAGFKEGRTVAMSEREVRTPVDVITVGRALIELAGSDHYGIFHLSGLSRVNRFELARSVAARFGFPQHLVLSQSANDRPDRARRPRDVSLDNQKSCAALKTRMRTLDEGLSLILDGV